MKTCTECKETYDPQLSNGSNLDLCQDCFDVYFDCKGCGECFNNDPNDPVDYCPECELLQSRAAST